MKIDTQNTNPSANTPAVGGTDTKAVDPFEAQLAAMLALAATAATVPPAPAPIFTLRGAATTGVTTLVVMATAGAVTGVVYGVWRLVKKP